MITLHKQTEIYLFNMKQLTRAEAIRIISYEAYLRMSTPNDTVVVAGLLLANGLETAFGVLSDKALINYLNHYFPNQYEIQS